jgi:hypothetical protein
MDDETRILKINTFCDEEIERRKKDNKTLREIKKCPSGKRDVETYLSMVKDNLKRRDEFNKLVYTKPWSSGFIIDQNNRFFNDQMKMTENVFKTFLPDINKELKAQVYQQLGRVRKKIINEIIDVEIGYDTDKNIDFIFYLKEEIKFRTARNLSRWALAISIVALGTVAFFSIMNFTNDKTWQDTQTPILKAIEKSLTALEDKSLQQSQIKILEEIRDRIPPAGE